MKIITRKVTSATTRHFQLEPLETFSGVNLPTNKDILRRYFALRDNSVYGTSKQKITTQIYEELEGLYGKVPVLMKKKSYGIKKILKLQDTWQFLNKNKKMFKNQS